MSKKQLIGFCVAVLLALHVVILGMVWHRSRWSKHLEEVTAEERKTVSAGLRLRKLTENAEAKNDLVGTLVAERYWTEVLPLAKEQTSAIAKLDALLTESRHNSYITDADYLDGNPRSFQEYLRRGEARRDDAIRHAQRMVVVGLLSEPQAAFVIQRVVSDRKLDSLYDENVQDLLNLSKSQRERLKQLALDTANSLVKINAFTLDPDQQKRNEEKGAAIKRKHDAAVKRVLTSNQLRKWSGLAGDGSLPPKSPDLPPLSDVEDAKGELLELSPTFLFISTHSDSLGLSMDQRRLLADLEEVTCKGLAWMDLQNGVAPPARDLNERHSVIPESRAEFVRNAEQVALLAILTQTQQEQVETAVDKN